GPGGGSGEVARRGGIRGRSSLAAGGPGGDRGEDVMEQITIAEEPLEAPESQGLLGELEADLRRRYRGDSHPWVEPSPLDVASFLVARDGRGRPVGCVALRRGDDHEFVIKRMYVRPEVRGRRLGDRLLAAIEERAQQLGAKRLK